jgi:hypothetical protein
LHNRVRARVRVRVRVRLRLRLRLRLRVRAWGEFRWKADRLCENSSKPKRPWYLRGGQGLNWFAVVSLENTLNSELRTRPDKARARTARRRHLVTTQRPPQGMPGAARLGGVRPSLGQSVANQLLRPPRMAGHTEEGLGDT